MQPDKSPAEMQHFHTVGTSKQQIEEKSMTKLIP